jgi:hypothetical protein
MFISHHFCALVYHRLSAHSSHIMETDRGLDVKKTYDSLMTSMNEYQGKSFTLWCDQVTSTSDEKLNQPLLRIGSDVTPTGQQVQVTCGGDILYGLGCSCSIILYGLGCSCSIISFFNLSN